MMKSSDRTVRDLPPPFIKHNGFGQSTKKASTQYSVIGEAGEYLILSNLLRLNFIAGKAPHNTRFYDLMVFKQDGTPLVPIQVKTTIKKERGWILQDKHEVPVKNLFFCFVKMQRNSNENEIYVIDSETVAHVAKMSHEIYLKLPGLKGQKHNDSSVRKLYRNYEYVLGKRKLKEVENYLTESELEFLSKYSEGWLDQYKDAWYLVESCKI